MNHLNLIQNYFVIVATLSQQFVQPSVVLFIYSSLVKKFISTLTIKILSKVWCTNFNYKNP